MNKTMKTIKATGSCFIIPNRAAKMNDQYWLDPEYTMAMTKEQFEINNMEFDPECKLIEVWIHSNDLNTDNLNCHGGWLVPNGHIAKIGASIHYIPSTFFERRKEGSVIKFNIRGWIRLLGESESEDVILEMDMTLDQLSSRYRNCGPFEMAFKAVTQ